MPCPQQSSCRQDHTCPYPSSPGAATHVPGLLPPAGTEDEALQRLLLPAGPSTLPDAVSGCLSHPCCTHHCWRCACRPRRRVLLQRAATACPASAAVSWRFSGASCCPSAAQAGCTTKARSHLERLRKQDINFPKRAQNTRHRCGCT